MNEAFLHYAWRTRRFEIRGLTTTGGEQVQILNFGNYHTDSGPDFKDARIRIGDTLWAGHVEMHLRASDWTKHGHQSDPAYDNVILHVVMEEDECIRDRNGVLIPCLELKAFIEPGLLANYERLQFHQPWIPCQKQVGAIPEIRILPWIDRMLAERMAARARQLKKVVRETNGHWEEAFYICLARSFGLFQNRNAFESLARRIPLKIIQKHRGQRIQIEAILFGVAGLLPENPGNQYVRQLRREFNFLLKKYDLAPLNPVIWQFFRMRPTNFPTIRIAQFATFLNQIDHLLNPFLEPVQIKTIRNIFQSVEIDPYWDTHYHFHKESPNRTKTIGRSFVDLVIINTIAPFLFLYGTERNQKKWIDRAIFWMSELPPERNRTIRKWKDVGIAAKSAGQSQGLIHLKQMYCDQKACLDCGIGHQVLSLDNGEPNG